MLYLKENSRYRRENFMFFWYLLSTTPNSMQCLNSLAPTLRNRLPLPASHPLDQWALEVLSTYGKILMTYVLPHHRASCLDSIVIYTFQILHHFFLSPVPFLLRFLFHLITEFEVKLYHIFSPWSQIRKKHDHSLTVWLRSTFSSASSI